MDKEADEGKKTTQLLEDISSKLEIILLTFKDFIETFKTEKASHLISYSIYKINSLMSLKMRKTQGICLNRIQKLYS